MKKSLLSLFTVGALATAWITLNSNANGPGGNRTGSPGSSGNCGSCHGGGNFSGQLTVGAVEIGDTNFISTYTPGKDYEVLVKAKSTSTRLGFQATASTANGNAAGTYGTAPSGTITYTSGTKMIWGHTTPSTTGIWRIKWTAPSSGAGTVTFYSSCVFSNANGRDNGDQVGVTSKSVTEAASTSTNRTINFNSIKLLGNPGNSEVKLSEPVQKMLIWNINGQIVASSNHSEKCNVAHLNAGTYFLQILTNNNQYQQSTIEVQ